MRIIYIYIYNSERVSIKKEMAQERKSVSRGEECLHTAGPLVGTPARPSILPSQVLAANEQKMFEKSRTNSFK